MAQSLHQPYNIGQLIAAQVANQPHKTAILDDHFSFSYAEIDLEAKKLAQKLRSQSFQDEEPVSILASHGIDNVISQIAVVYAGGTCVPLDPTMSDDDIQARAQLADAKFLILSPSHADRQIPIRYRFTVNHHEAHSDDIGEQRFCFPVLTAPDYRSHIFFTSGTTGIPKGVETLGRGIIRLRNGIFDPNDRVAHLNSACFDASVLDIWTALTVGATVVIVQRDLLLNPQQFSQLLDQRAITSLFLTASLFSVVALECPSTFRNCNSVLIGGEAPNIAAVRKVLETAPPKHLFNVYGPTECSVLSTAHEISLEDIYEEQIPLGAPFESTELYLLDDSLQLIQGEGTGELFIGGHCLARGYLCDSSKTNQSFLRIPGISDGEDTTLLYRTNDIVRRDHRGRLFWQSRRNNEIKHRGHRVNLDIVESALCKTGLVSSAAALKLDDPKDNASWLVACVILKDPDSTTREDCQREANARLPIYMVPQVTCLDKMPINRNGKVDRKQLESILLRRRLEYDTGLNASGLSPTEKKVRSIWQRALGAIIPDDIGSDTSFFLLGATSLDVSAATLMIRQAFKIPFPVQNLYESPILRELSQEIDQEVKGLGKLSVDEAKHQWLKDVDMIEQLQIIPQDSPIDWTADGEGKVFITGATGFIGAFFLKLLTNLPFVQSVRCLVRATTLDQGKQRIFDNMSKYNLLEDLGEHQKSKIVPIIGDLSHPILNLGAESYAELAGWASVIYHIGAQVNYNQPYSSHRAANVLGTFNVLKLAATCRLKPVHYASSIAAFGPSALVGKNIISEDEDLDPFIDAIPYETGYGQSQWVADKMVKRAIEKKLPAAIYRFGFVLCDSITGAGNPDDYMGRLIADTLTLGIYPLLPLQRKELLPVDYAVSAVLSTSLSIDNLGKAYHITPDLEEAHSMDITGLFEVIGEITGRNLRALPYDQWVMKLKEFSQTNEARLKPLMPILEETVLNNKTRWELYENMARFRNDNTRAALLNAKQSSLLERSAVTRNSLKLYLGHLALGSSLLGPDGLGKSSDPMAAGILQQHCGVTV